MLFMLLYSPHLSLLIEYETAEMENEFSLSDFSPVLTAYVSCRVPIFTELY